MWVSGPGARNWKAMTWDSSRSLANSRMRRISESRPSGSARIDHTMSLMESTSSRASAATRSSRSLDPDCPRWASLRATSLNMAICERLAPSSTGAGGLASNAFSAYAAQPIEPGHRNQYNLGLEQSLTRYLQLDADYFWKFTSNAFDFGTLLNTPLVFPISWSQSKIDGVSLRLSTTSIHGFQAYTTMGSEE